MEPQCQFLWFAPSPPSDGILLFQFARHSLHDILYVLSCVSRSSAWHYFLL